jgi:zinc transport system permease protein
MTGCCEMIGCLPFEWAAYAFMQQALLAVLLLAPLLALLGCLVISNQMSFFSEALGHSALTGLAIGTLLGVGDPVFALTGCAVLLALAMFALRRYSAVPADTVIALTMAFVVSLGIVLLSRGGGFAKYARYLIGDILTITSGELAGLALLLAAVLALWAVLFNAFFLVSLNRSLATSRGIPVHRIEALFAVVVAIVVAVSIPWVGLLVINSMLILPAATARNVARNTRHYVLGAVTVSLLSGVLGLVCSYYWNTAAGATIVLWASGFFALSLLFRR